MRYHGGKAARGLGKAIAAILNEAARERNASRYVEPFCGGGSVLVHVDHPKRFASDIHPDIVLLLEAVSNGWEPPSNVSEKMYAQLRNGEPSALRGFVGFTCSFGAKWFGGYARSNSRNFADEGRRALLRDAPRLVGVEFRICPYTAWRPRRGWLVYCDPPYVNTTAFDGAPPFDSDRFWAWATKAAKAGADVFVSEERAPRGWCSVWEKAVVRTTTVTKSAQHVAIEKLFRYVG